VRRATSSYNHYPCFIICLADVRFSAIRRALTILQNDLLYSRISNFVKSPILSAAYQFLTNANRGGGSNSGEGRVEKHSGGIYYHTSLCFHYWQD